MKIVSDCFNFVKTMLSYIKFKNYMSISQGRRQNLVRGEAEHRTKFYT